MSHEKLHIRDGRKRDRYSIDHTIFRQKPGDQEKCWAALIKPAGMAIYNAIVHHSDYNSQESYPSFSTLAKETGMSLSQAKREVKKLVDFRFITIVPPDNARSSNTYILTDNAEWIVPENYQTDYAPKNRSDRGKANPKRSRKKAPVGVSQTPGAVSERHQGGSVTETPEVVSDRHYSSITETPGLVSERPPNIDPNVNTSHLSNTNSNIQAESTAEHPTNNPSDDGQKIVGAVAAEINQIFSLSKREERITKGNLKKITSLHELHSEEEILKAVRSLASKEFTFAGKQLGNAIGFLFGKKNGDGEYHSNCFFDHECILPEPLPQPASPEQEAIRAEEIDWQARFNALPSNEQARFRAEAELTIRSHKANMSPKVYQETLQIAILNVFSEAESNPAEPPATQNSAAVSRLAAASVKGVD